MIGKVIEGRYSGASVNKLPDKNVLYIETEEGSKIALSKKNVISIDDVTAEYPNNGQKVMMVMWNDFETSVIMFGTLQKKEAKQRIDEPEEKITSDRNVQNKAADKTSGFSLPRRFLWVGVAIIALVIIGIFIGKVSGGTDKLSGSFVDPDNGWRYEFLTTGTGRGDYGGDHNLYNKSGELLETHSWYIEGNTVYIDGDAEYGYDGTYIYSLTPIDWIVVENENRLSGSNSNWERNKAGGMWFTGLLETDKWCYYIESSGIFIGDSYQTVAQLVEGTYTVEDSIVRIYDESGNVDYTYIIVDGTVRGTLLIPV